MAKDLGPLSGFRDLMADQMIVRNQVLDTVINCFERYGFMPIKTPAIERFETLNGKYGEEASTLIYDLKDKGDRHLALRYDHTVPLARIMATQAKSMSWPFKRYVIGDVWRGESPQAGRYREFTQIDADIIGSASYLADSETIAMMHSVFEALKVKVSIEVNDRRILDGLAEVCGIKVAEDFNKFVGLIDKESKIGSNKVLAEIKSMFGDSAHNKVAEYMEIKGEDFDEVLKLLPNKSVEKGVDSLRQIFTALDNLGCKDIKFNPRIARGLNYYTSTIFETTLDGLPELGSVCSGGRYDKLIGVLGGPDVPAVGTSIGLDRLMEGLNTIGKVPNTSTKTEVYIVNLDPALDAERLSLAEKLRSNGIPTELYYEETKLGKQLEFISKQKVNKVLIYGPKEHEAQVVIIRDLASSTQQEVPLDEVLDNLKSS